MTVDGIRFNNQPSLEKPGSSKTPRIEIQVPRGLPELERYNSSGSSCDCSARQQVLDCPPFFARRWRSPANALRNHTLAIEGHKWIDLDGPTVNDDIWPAAREGATG